MPTSQENTITIDNKTIGEDFPTYFIADIAANHDGDLNRAIELIFLAAEAGADAAKFQHFSADSIVSDLGFKALNSSKSHQAKWKKSVYEIYKEASVDLNWTPFLKEACNKAGISFFTSPYSLELVDAIDSYVPSYKIGSGDITWHEIIHHIASKNKPYILATGASSMQDVQRAVDVGLSVNSQLALLQCNTNYTASIENFHHLNLNVLKTYRSLYPNMVLGLSDHTPGHVSVLGAIALGARIIEKHFTSDTKRDGPDHLFSMDPQGWREMIDRSRDLENSLGNGLKIVEANEVDTMILQRRSIRTISDIPKGGLILRSNLTILRPCPSNAITPDKIDEVIGRVAKTRIPAGDHLKWTDLI